MKKCSINSKEVTLQLSWEDFATLLPTEVSKKVAEYANENVTPSIMVSEATGKMWSATPLFANVKNVAGATSPTIQTVDDNVMAALKAKGRLTWKDAEQKVRNRRLFHELFRLGIVKTKEECGVKVTVSEADIVAINSFIDKLNENRND